MRERTTDLDDIVQAAMAHRRKRNNPEVVALSGPKERITRRFINSFKQGMGWASSAASDWSKYHILFINMGAAKCATAQRALLPAVLVHSSSNN